MSDLDLEWLASGKSNTNDAVLHPEASACNCLRLIRQLGLNGEIATTLRPAKRGWLKTVLQHILYRSAKFAYNAVRLVLDFDRDFADHVEAFVALEDRLLRAASP